MELMKKSIREIVRKEYFSGVGEPMITFRKPTVRPSASCLNSLPLVNYVQFAVYRVEKKLAIEPCDPEERDAVRWSSQSLERKPKIMTCREFYRRVSELMQWSDDCRYKVYGKLP